MYIKGILTLFALTIMCTFAEAKVHVGLIDVIATLETPFSGESPTFDSIFTVKADFFTKAQNLGKVRNVAQGRLLSSSRGCLI